MKATIYHNPRCSKSRQTLALLKDQPVELEVIEYLKTPPDHETLRDILAKLDIAPFALIRKGEAVFATLKLSDKRDDADALIDAMVNNPILIERPIVLANDKAAIGRPPVSALAILSP